MDGNTNAIGVVHDGTAVSVTESLTQIEIEIVNYIFRSIPVHIPVAYKA